MIEPPDGSVLRVRCPGDVVVFIERDDSWHGASPCRWFLPTGDPETWEQIEQRLRRAVEWQLLTVAVDVTEAMRRLRVRFDEALRQADEAETGGPRAAQVQVALSVERAAQALAEVTGIEAVNWSRGGRPAPEPDDATQELPPVLQPVPPMPPGGPVPVRDVLRHVAGSLRFRAGRPPIGANQPPESRWGTAVKRRANGGKR